MDKVYEDRITASVEYLKSKIHTAPKIAVILGSGLGDFGEMLVDKASINTKDIPFYPVSSVEGHAGKILFGRITSGSESSSDLMVFQGRIHFYESNDTATVAYPIEVAHRMGIEKIIITNAAGGVNKQFVPGDRCSSRTTSICHSRTRSAETPQMNEECAGPNSAEHCSPKQSRLPSKARYRLGKEYIAGQKGRRMNPPQKFE